MQQKIIAHKYKDGSVQLLQDHLKNVADLSAEYADKCGLNKDHMRQIAMLHDYGKCSTEFQDHICNDINNGVSHSNVGGKILFDAGDLIGSLCVFGHHTGLMDVGTKQTEGTLLYRYDMAGQEQLHFLLDKPDVVCYKPEKIFSEAIKYPYFDNMLETRMYLSCLLDADWEDSSETVEKESYDDWGTIYERFHFIIKEKFGNAENTPINKWRSDIFKECQEKGKNGEEKIVSLSAPTGSGKTLASMAFALERVKRGKANRIIYCIPYTSIIEQNAEEFREFLGSQNVLEHHSLAEYKREEHSVSEDQYYNWTVGNWDSPIILTTNVMFFESLLSASKQKIRKLHNIANSVIIFDEVQMLPMEFLTCCKELIKILVEQYGCTVVLCTATQPSLDIGEIGNELIENPKHRQGRLNRVKIENIKKYLAQEDLVSLLSADVESDKSVLCVVNKKKTAQEVYYKLKKNKNIKCYHLSLNMCAEHRKKVFDEIKKDLKAKNPICVISTSLIEAGVDISFAICYRELAGFDRVIQVAGRSNRHGEFPFGVLKIFRLNGERYFYSEQFVADKLLRSGIDIFSEEAVAQYYNELYSFYNITDFDKNGIMEYAKKLSFRGLGSQARFIQDNDVQIVVPYDENAIEIINDLMSNSITREMWRELRKYVVSISQKVFDEMDKLGAFNLTENEIYVLKSLDGFYDEDCGILI